MPKVKANRYWNNHKNVDSAFDNLEKELGHIPTSREFRDVNECAFKAIANGRYNSDIKTWNGYLTYRDKKVNQERGIWTPKKIDEAFDTLESQLKKTPSQDEFKRKYFGAFDSIVSGRYAKEVTSWNAYLKKRDKETNVDLTNWSPKAIDEAFDTLERKLGKTPTSVEFHNLHGAALRAISKGRYNSDIKTWNGYLTYRDKKVNQERGIWTPKKIDEAFDTLESQLKKTPSQDEFINKYSGAMKSIRRGIFSGINSWNDYLKHRGKLVLHDIGRWSSPNKIDEAFDRLEESLGRTPRRKDFVIKYAGALSAIVQGRYNKNIHYWNEYLMFRNRVINKKSGKDTTLILESLLEEGGTQ